MRYTILLDTPTASAELFHTNRIGEAFGALKSTRIAPERNEKLFLIDAVEGAVIADQDQFNANH